MRHRPYSFLFVILVLGAFLGLEEQAQAASGQNEDLFELSLDDLMQIEVASATRTLESLAEVPAAITVFTRSELNKLGVDFLYELLSYVPGYQTSRDGDFSTSYLYSARGSDTGQYTTAILILIDGIPRQEIVSASASSLTSLISLDRIERIEIMRGPGSALYGSGAFLGVINIVTVEGENKLKAQIGQPDRQQLNGQFSQQIGKVKVDAFLSHYQDKGQNFRLDDRISDELKATSDPRTAADYVLQFAMGTTRLIVEQMEYQSDDFYTISAINNDFNAQERSFSQIALEHTFNWLKVGSELRLAYNENSQEYWAQGAVEDQFTNISVPSSDAALFGHAYDQSDQWLLQWFNDWQINGSNSLQFGAEYQHDSLRESWVATNFDTQALAYGNLPIASSPAIDIYAEYQELQSRDIMGVYGQWQTKLNDLTRFTMGARYDHYQDFDENVSLRLSLVRQLSANQYLKLIYGEAFRAPSLRQLGIKENLTVARNPDLEAETIQTSEIIWVIQEPRYSLTATGFYNVIDNRINSSGFIDGRRADVNEAREYSGGIELESTIQLSQYWLLKASFTELLKLPEASFQISDRLASMILNYQRSDWWFNLSGYYNSAREMPLQEYPDIDGFWVLNGKIGLNLDHNFNVNFQVKNLLDEDYGSTPPSEQISTPLPYRGREISVGVDVTF